MVFRGKVREKGAISAVVSERAALLLLAAERDVQSRAAKYLGDLNIKVGGLAACLNIFAYFCDS